MKTSSEILMKSGLLPKLQLGIRKGTGRTGKNGLEIVNVVPTGKHTVKMIEDKIVKKPIREEGDDVHWVRYIVEEDGVQKQYDTRMKEKGGNDPSYFVQAMAAVEPGEVITLEMKKAGIKNYIEILRPSTGEVSSADIGDDESEENTVNID
jgi:hypothetical protein